MMTFIFFAKKLLVCNPLPRSFSDPYLVEGEFEQQTTEVF